MKARILFAAAVAVFTVGAVPPAISLGQNVTTDDMFDAPDVHVTFDGDNLVVEEREIVLRKAQEAQKAAQQAMEKAQEDMKRVQHVHIERLNHMRMGHSRHMAEIRQAAEKYRDAEGEAQKSEWLHRLRDIVEESFEEGMKVRERELAEVESRVQKLRVQLERRRAKKEEIVDLQVKVAINEAEGLGFTSHPPAPMPFDFTVPVPVKVRSAPAADAAPFQPPTAPDASPFEPRAPRNPETL